MKRCALLVIPALLLSGCSAFQAPPFALTPSSTLASPPRPHSSAEELVAFIARLRTLDEAGLNTEAVRQREFTKQSPSELARMKVALALAASPQSDEAEILALVEPLARETNGADADVQAMASFLQGVAIERRRLKESATTAGSRSRDDRRALETQKQRAETLQERNAQLQQKLDALTNLEKSLSSRKGN